MSVTPLGRPDPFLSPSELAARRMTSARAIEAPARNAVFGTGPSRVVLCHVCVAGARIARVRMVEVAGVEPASPRLLMGLLRAQPMGDLVRPQVIGTL